jgi:hypothetical protein
MDALTDPKRYMPDGARLATIKQGIDEYNAERPAIERQAYLQVGLYVGGYGAVMIFVLYLLLNSGYHGTHNPLAYLFAGLAICGWWVWDFAWRPVKDYQLGLRYRLFPVIFGFIDKVEYSNGRAPSFFSEIRRTKLVQFTSSDNDDRVSGSHDGLDFEMVESRLKVGSGRNRTTVFRGLLFRFTRDDDFPGLLVVARRGNWLQEWAHELFGTHDDTIPTGDPEIDLAYEIHADNYAAAKPLVEGSLAAALKYLKRKWPTGDARIALRGKECFLVLPTDRDYFHVPAISRDVDYRKDIEPMIRDMVVLLAVAHLIQKIG